MTELMSRIRSVLLGQDVASLSTHSSDCPGYPFGSVVPLGSDDMSRPILLISRLAQHTRNIAENPNVSLMLSDLAQLGNRDVQTCARVTLLGQAEKLDVDDHAQTVARYCRYYPQAESYYKELDFDFYRLEPKKVRFIAGFGQIHWVESDLLFSANPFAGEAEVDICAHMNTDHADALVRYCGQAAIGVPENVVPEMVGVDAYGFHQRVGERIYRFNFPEQVQTSTEVRQTLIAMLKQAND